jgi:cytochrome c553
VKLNVRPLTPRLWPALEAYPLDADRSPSATGTGYASTFSKADFKEIARHFAPRPIMRLDL